MNDYIQPRPETIMGLRGTDPALTSWQPGNRVLTNSLKGTGNPEGVTLFGSAMGDPLVGTSPSDTRTGYLDAEDTITNGSYTVAVILQKSSSAGPTAATRLSEPEVRQMLRH